MKRALSTQIDSVDTSLSFRLSTETDPISETSEGQMMDEAQKSSNL
jgi:hypothetical protein